VRESRSLPPKRVLWALAVTVVVTVGLTAAFSASSSDGDASRLTITTPSNPRHDFVSGGDVLVRVTELGGQGANPRVALNGRDVTSEFVEQRDGSMLGLVSDLREGRNAITAQSGLRSAELTVTNHDLGGPILSGEQQEPFYCETTEFDLEPAEQPRCEAPTRVSYRYRQNDGDFVLLSDPDDPPGDVATVTVRGRELPYVVRVETGTINRAVYETAVLYDDTDPSPTDPAAEPGWNGKLVYTFGGGCNGGYHQGAVTGGVLNDLLLSRGYGVASSTLNVLEGNCSPVISAETAMMVKERFAEVYGPITHTIGWGGSGGAIQQYSIADAYPGILDGIVPGVTYADPVAVMRSVTDCGLLNSYFGGEGATFTAEERRAIAGYVDYSTCTSWGSFLSRITPTDSCGPAIPAADRWDITANPHGVRCSAAEQWVNQLGRDPRTGFVRAVLDNVGVQYGLAALESGEISAAQFVRLNAGIGGYNVLGDRVGRRMSADQKALAAAYESGLVNTTGLGLRTTPIIDQRTYVDKAGAIEDIHTSEMSYVMRERLRAANGTAKNQVIIVNAQEPEQQVEAQAYALEAMDRWLTAIAADPSDRDLATKVVANKPADLGDGCYESAGELLREDLEYRGDGKCAELYPVGLNPRLVAGEGLAMSTVKCQLRPIDFDDYPVRFTVAQQEELRAAFPDGVCEYGLVGVEERPASQTWRSY
jgi:Tannase-like family of unknown function (DUF6351)